jgi:Na+/H+ antiporter NhaD/arsenite permease-like protein
MRNTLYFFGLLAATLGVLLGLRLVDVNFDRSQCLSILIFSTFIYGTLLFGEFRLAFAFGGIAALLALNLITIEGFTQSANLKVIVFLIGMFLVIGYLEENQFFEQIVNWIIARVGPRPKLLLLALMIMGTVSAALVDEVTSILFMTGTMLHLTSKYRLRPTPFIIMLVFATNIGSAASSIGNPIGVMIALNAGFSFGEFLRWSAPVALVVNVATYFVCRWWFAGSFKAFEDAVRVEHAALARRRAVTTTAPVRVSAGMPALAGIGVGGGSISNDEPGYAVEPVHVGSESMTDADHPFAGDEPHERNPALVTCWIVFGMTILALVTHGLTERLLGLEEGTMMIGAALAMGCIVLILRREKARELVERRVDWWTLSFFMMLFASVGTLEHTGVTRVIAQKLIHATGGNQFALISIVGWATGWLSAFLDNVLAVATFMPVIHDVRVAWAIQNPASPGYPAAIYWLMLFGGTFMGNMTVIGSTANIIAVGILEKRGHGTVRFSEWFKIGLIVSLVSMAIATAMLAFQTKGFSTPLLPPPPGTGAVHPGA